jgi:hypothetical protein
MDAFFNILTHSLQPQDAALFPSYGMQKMLEILQMDFRYRYLSPIILFLAVLLFIRCNNSHPEFRNYEMALREAKNVFYYKLNTLEINGNLFDGPFLLSEDVDIYIFQWKNNIKIPGSVLFQVTVPKRSEVKGSVIKTGNRKRIGFLSESASMSITKATLLNLFGRIPKEYFKDKGNENIIDLDIQYLKDLANFVEIKKELFSYYYCHHEFPKVLEDLNNNIDPINCSINYLDSLYLHDKNGNLYSYKNLGEFVLLGSSGANGTWNISGNEFDSLINENSSMIYINSEDIIVKFRPVW